MDRLKFSTTSFAIVSLVNLSLPMGMVLAETEKISNQNVQIYATSQLVNVQLGKLPNNQIFQDQPFNRINLPLHNQYIVSWEIPLSAMEEAMEEEAPLARRVVQEAQEFFGGMYNANIQRQKISQAKVLRTITNNSGLIVGGVIGLYSASGALIGTVNFKCDDSKCYPDQ